MAIKVHFMIGLLSWHAQQVSRGPPNKFDQDQLSAFAVRHGRPAPVELRAPPISDARLLIYTDVIEPESENQGAVQQNWR
jgi:hypothetical protein